MKETIINVNGMDYIIREDGKIFGTRTRGRGKYRQEIKQRLNKDGYKCITVGVNGNRKTERVHRLVAKAFIPNPDNLPEVNHKDFNRANNCVSNLEWCTHNQNIQYTINAGRHISTTRDSSGKNNPNYMNHKLSQRYKENPDYAKSKQSRPGELNGRATKIYLFNKEYIMEFPYIQACAEYVIEKLDLKKSSSHSLAGRIPKYAKTGHLYKNTYYFSKDNTVLSLNNEESATTTENIA